MKKQAGWILLIAICSCKKEQVSTYSEATYEITLQGQWKAPQFSVPPSAHFTAFVGIIHNNDVTLWKEGSTASVGVENVAEDGNSSTLLANVNSHIASMNAITAINIPPPPPAGTISRNVYLNSNYSLISLQSMVAPSPDWFVGVTRLDLYHNSNWIKDSIVNLYVYDAGTEDGDIFGYNNPATMPHQNIQLLTAGKGTVLSNGNSTLAAIATVRFRKL